MRRAIGVVAASVGRVALTRVSELHVSDENPRTIEPGRLEQLKRALEADPEMLRARPVVCLPDGTVVAGNMRLVAARELGWDKIPAVRADLDQERARLWMLRDNQAYGDWEEEGLAALLGELERDGADLDLAGFVEDDLRRLLDSLKPIPIGDPDEIPDVPDDPISEVGEIYELGGHLLLCGDSFDAAARDRLIAGGTPDCLVTDPPYGISLETDWTNPRGRVNGRAYRKVEGDDTPFDASILVDWSAGIGEQFWFGANYYRRSLGGSDRDGSWLVWDKRDEVTDSVIGSAFELIWSKVPHKQDMLRFGWTNFTSHTNAGLKREHPTEKPVALVAEILGRWTKPEDTIIDLFAGAGTTMIAAEQLGRRSLLIEIDPRYCDVIRQRYEDFVGG